MTSFTEMARKSRVRRRLLKKKEDTVLHLSHLAGGVVGMLCQFGVHAFQADGVGDFTDSEASFV